MRCTSCGAPWEPDVAGRCRFCHQLGRPPGVAGPVGAALDPVILCSVLLGLCQDGADPLGRLAVALVEGLGPQAARPVHDGAATSRLWVQVGDLTFDHLLGPGGVRVEVVHEVRGVVLKRESLDLVEGVAALSFQLADLAGHHPQLRAALVSRAQ